MSMYNDPLSNHQWHLLQIGRDRLGVEYSGANVKVGVFDDGLQADHPDLVPNYNAGLHVTIAGQAVAPDAGAHGTAVAGIIAAAANATGRRQPTSSRLSGRWRASTSSIIPGV